MFLCTPFWCFSQFYNAEVEAEINIDIQDNSVLKIVGSAHNKTQLNQSLKYVLSVITSDKDLSNKSSNKQEGRIVLDPGIKKNISETSISINDTNRTIILLLIYNIYDKIISKARKVLNGFEGETDALPLPGDKPEENDIKTTNKESSFILKGVVIEDTKTKAGNDFYDLFYSSYLAKNINGEKVIKIEEHLAIANNTQIKIFVESELIVQFFVNPRSQYLKSMADFSINKVILYFENMKNTKEQITKY